MKYILFLAISLTSTVSFGQSIEVLESEKYSNLREITIKTVSKKSSDSTFFAKKKAEKKAINAATEAANNFFSQTCTEGLESDYVDHDTEECIVLNKETNEVKCTVQSKAHCKNFSGISSASGLNFKLGHTQSSTACLNLIKESNYSVDSSLIENCNKINNLIQFECVEILTRYNSVKTYAVGKCGSFENIHALNVLREFTEEGEDGKAYTSPGVDTINLISKVDTLKEETCFKNKMRLSELNTGDLQKCTNEIKEEADSVFNRLRDWFN